MIETMPNLKTLAVGGAAAGQIIYGEYGQAKYFVKEISAALSVKEPLAYVTSRWEYYREMRLTYHGKDKKYHTMRFWAAESSIKDEWELLQELAANYRPVYQDFLP